MLCHMNVAYHCQDAVRARDRESIVALIARLGRLVNTSYWNRRAAVANRIV